MPPGALSQSPELCGSHTTMALWVVQISGAAETGPRLGQSSLSCWHTSGKLQPHTIALRTSGQHKPITLRGNSKRAAQPKLEHGPNERVREREREREREGGGAGLKGSFLFQPHEDLPGTIFGAECSAAE